jgi:hypothetical protein
MSTSAATIPLETRPQKYHLVRRRTELVNAEDEDGLVDLEAEDLGLDQGERLSVDLDKTFTGLENSFLVSCPAQTCGRAS